jgi:phosphatidylinositol glycan class S
MQKMMKQVSTRTTRAVAKATSANVGGLFAGRGRGRRDGRRGGMACRALDEMFETEVNYGAYLTLGISNCFKKDEEGKLLEALVIEPINATTLETMSIGAKTSYKYVTGVTLGDIVEMDKAAFNLPEDYLEAEFCEDFVLRSEICARTWDREYPQEQLMDIVPLGSSKTDWNFDISTHKRILNEVHVVTDEDNIKQDKSIDVYDRFSDEDEEKAE